jgi:hypothetical protein
MARQEFPKDQFEVIVASPARDPFLVKAKGLTSILPADIYY